MITLTDKAVRYITRLFEKADIKPHRGGIRFGIKSGGCSGHHYFFELIKDETPKDHIMYLSGIRVIVDPKSLQLMRNTEIDYSHDLPDSLPFIFHNPNTRSTCGCVVLFTIEDPRKKKPV